MTKFEFLGDLSRLIADLPEEDREQAMEYYEDYFADAGPEKEQEIIKDFISPAYIAEQLREASAQRLENEAANTGLFGAPQKTPEKTAVFSRKSAAQAAHAQQEAPAATSAAPSAVASKQAETPVASQAASSQAVTPATSQAAASAQTAAASGTATPHPETSAPAAQQPAQASASAAQQTTQASTPASQQTAQTSAPASQQTTQASAPASQQTAQTSAPASQQTAQPSVSAAQQPAQAPTTAASEAASASMRNPIFQQFAENTKEEQEALELKKKTKVDIKSINSTTSKVDKKQAKNAKKLSAEEKAYEASLYSSSRKAMIAVLLLVTCPITLFILGVLILLLLLALGIVLGFVVLGGGCIIASVLALVISILSLMTMHVPNFVFVLGLAFLLFAIGSAICYLDYSLFTHGIPGAYYSIMVQVNNIKSALKRFAMKK